MSELVRVCRAEDVTEDEPVSVDVQGFPPLAAFEIGGEYFVTDNNCTHGKGLLSEGLQKGGTIKCPFHGGVFDIKTGEAVAYPCQKPLRTYGVTLIDGWIMITNTTR